MILSYTLPNAEQNILAGIKIHTIRADKVNRWKAGYEIHHAVNNRTPQYRCFLKNRCRSTQQVLIVLLKGTSQPPILSITVDRRRLNREEVHKLAVNDGFNGEAEMIKWFFKDPKDEVWSGKIIHWTPFKY